MKITANKYQKLMISVLCLTIAIGIGNWICLDKLSNRMAMSMKVIEINKLNPPPNNHQMKPALIVFGTIIFALLTLERIDHYNQVAEIPDVQYILLPDGDYRDMTITAPTVLSLRSGSMRNLRLLDRWDTAGGRMIFRKGMTNFTFTGGVWTCTNQ